MWKVLGVAAEIIVMNSGLKVPNNTLYIPVQAK